MQSGSLWCISHIWVSQVQVWHHCQHVFASSWTRQSRPSLFFPRVRNFSIVTTNACCRVRLARATFTTADGKVATFARCCPLGPSHCFCHDVHGFTEEFHSFFVTFVLVSYSSVCLLVVSRLLGLTLRLFAPVCSCHRDSLTRWRLAIVQEAVRVLFFSQSSRLVSVRDDMCLVVSDSLRGRSFHAMLKYESPAAIVKLFPHFPPFLDSGTVSTICSGYAWARSKRVTSWCVECNLQDWWRTNPTNLPNTESLCWVCFVHLRG